MKNNPLKQSGLLFAAIGILTAVSISALLTACEVGSPNTVIRSVRIDVNGVYANSSDDSCNDSDGFVKGRPSISYMNILQTGDQLQGIDTQGTIYNGTIGVVDGDSASFTLNGNGVIITGTFTVSGSDGKMTGTWIEDSFSTILCGTSSGQSIQDTTPIDTNTTTSLDTEHGTLTPEAIAAHSQTALWFYEG